MLLNDGEILKLIQADEIQICPEFRLEDVRPAGLRVHLGPELLVPEPGQEVDLLEPDSISYRHHDLGDRPFVLEPGGFVLGSTIERLRTSADLMCLLDGRSTLARLGISIHNTASFLDGTQHGWLTPVLEIANHGNLRLKLHPGIPIGMICFQRLSGASSAQSHHDQYTGQNGTVPPNLLRGAKPIGVAVSSRTSRSR